MISFADNATQLNICKAFAIALPRFYKRTGISAQFVFAYNNKEKDLEISLGFLPNEPTEKEYSILFEEITEAEKLLMNEYVVNNAKNHETVAQLIFKCKEDTRKIVEKHKSTIQS